MQGRCDGNVPIFFVMENPKWTFEHLFFELLFCFEQSIGAWVSQTVEFQFLVGIMTFFGRENYEVILGKNICLDVLNFSAKILQTLFTFFSA